MSPRKQAKFNRDQALSVVGSLSNTSKMPVMSWGLDAKRCITGSKLRKVAGSICKSCYCCRGNFLFPCVVNAQQKRLDLFNQSLENDGGSLWVAAMTLLIKNGTDKFFRLFDSGDLQSEAMLACIVQVAKNCKSVKFWLPTKEYGFVGDFIRHGGEFPKNLNVRLSGYMRDTPAPLELAASMGCTASAVTTGAGDCYAQTSGNGTCGQCRKCWNKNVPSISYQAH